MKRIPVIFFSLVFPMLHLFSMAQVIMPVFGKQPFISGFAKELRGETISYSSLFPQYVKDALLTRCTNGQWAFNEKSLNGLYILRTVPYIGNAK